MTEDQKGELYLDRVESVGMDAIIKAVEENDQVRAFWVLELLKELSIV